MALYGQPPLNPRHLAGGQRAADLFNNRPRLSTTLEQNTPTVGAAPPFALPQMSAPSNSEVYVPPGYAGIANSPVNNNQGLAPDGSMPPPPGTMPTAPMTPEPIGQTRFEPNGESAGRAYGRFRQISQRGGPEYRPSNTAELIRRAAARRLGLD